MVLASPVEGRLDKVPGVFKDIGLAMCLGEDRVEHKLLRSVLTVHLHRRLVDETNGSLAVLVHFVSDCGGGSKSCFDTLVAHDVVVITGSTGSCDVVYVVYCKSLPALYVL